MRPWGIGLGEMPTCRRCLSLLGKVLDMPCARSESERQGRRCPVSEIFTGKLVGPDGKEVLNPERPPLCFREPFSYGDSVPHPSCSHCFTQQQGWCTFLQLRPLHPPFKALPSAGAELQLCSQSCLCPPFPSPKGHAVPSLGS